MGKRKELEVRFTGKFKKDFKKYRNNPSKVKKIYEVIDMLRKEIPLPKEYKAHTLVGNYKGYMECHIESDLLLIWWDKEKGVITLVRLGSHSELFKS